MSKYIILILLISLNGCCSKPKVVEYKIQFNEANHKFEMWYYWSNGWGKPLSNFMPCSSAITPAEIKFCKEHQYVEK